MKTKLLASMLGSAATLTAIAGANPASAFSLRPDLLETFKGMVNTEMSSLNNPDSLRLDPNSLRWVKGIDSADVFFINEGAKFRNQLLYSANGGQKQMIFNDIASSASKLPEADGPLSLGEGVSLGKFEGDTILNFFVKAHGKNGGQNIYGADDALNPDGLQHLIAYNYFDRDEQQNYAILAFEDLFGSLNAGYHNRNQNSDRDFNDVVFAIRGVVARQADPASIPEPSATLALIGAGLFGLARCRRRSHSEIS